MRVPFNILRKKFGIYGFGLVAMLVPAAMQFGLFAFFAWVLGAQQYGLYIALMSWSPICFELVGWGAGEYLLKRTAQDKTSFPAARGHLRATFWLSLPVAVLAFVVPTFGMFGHTMSVWTIIIIGLAEFVGLRLLVNAEQMALALGSFGSANWLRALQVAPRIAGVALAYFVLGQQSFSSLAVAGSLGILCAGLLAAWVMYGRWPSAAGATVAIEGLRHGTWFTGNQLVRASQHNIDRVVLAPLVDPATLALYSAAQRFIQIGLLPLQSVLRITYTGFFQAGTGGIGMALRYGISVLPWAVAASAMTAIVLLASAHLLPLVIGSDFEQSVNYLIYLAPTLLLFALNSTMADTLSGAGLLSLRLLLTVCGVAVQALLFVFLHEGMGLVLASYAGIGVSCVLTTGAVLLLLWRQRRIDNPAAGSA